MSELAFGFCVLFFEPLVVDNLDFDNLVSILTERKKKKEQNNSSRCSSRVKSGAGSGEEFFFCTDNLVLNLICQTRQQS